MSDLLHTFQVRTQHVRNGYNYRTEDHRVVGNYAAVTV
jgi:hypothetical protein